MSSLFFGVSQFSINSLILKDIVYFPLQRLRADSPHLFSLDRTSHLRKLYFLGGIYRHLHQELFDSLEFRWAVFFPLPIIPLFLAKPLF
jgi:hypothetical protein